MADSAHLVIRVNTTDFDTWQEEIQKQQLFTDPERIIVSKDQKYFRKVTRRSAHPRSKAYHTWVKATKAKNKVPYVNNDPIDWTGAAANPGPIFSNVGYVQNTLKIKDANGVPYHVMACLSQVGWLDHACR